MQEDSPYSSVSARLIIIEDDISIYQLLKSFLHLRFPEILIVGHCETVHEVSSLVSTQNPDILLMDIALQDGTAFEGLAAISNRGFDIIVMTAQAEFYFAQEAIRHGAADYLLKPFDPHQVTKAIEKVLAKRSQSAAQISTDTVQQASATPVEPSQMTSLSSGLLSGQPKQTLPSSLAYTQNNTASERRIVVTTHDGTKTTHVLECSSIVRLDAAGKHTFVHLLNHNKLLIPQTLEKAADMLPADMFYRVHRSHIINLGCLKYARDGFAFLANGDRVDVSSRIWVQFLRHIRQISSAS